MKRLIGISLCAVVLLVAGCRPRGVLSVEQMEDVLYDLHRTEGILHASGYERGHDSVVCLTYNAVLARHGITRAEFDSLLVWYTDNPQFFDKIYPHVLERLEKDKSEAEDRRKQASGAMTDSLQRIAPIQLRQH